MADVQKFENRRDNTNYILSMTKGFNRSYLEKLSNKQISKMANNIKKGIRADEGLSSSSSSSSSSSEKEQRRRRGLQKEEAYRQAIYATRRFKTNPSLENHRRAIAMQVGYDTKLPEDVTEIIGEMAGDPEIRLKTVPKKGKRIPQAKNALFKILSDVGVTIEDFNEDILGKEQYFSKGKPVTKASQVTDKVVLDILNDYEDQDLKLFYNPDAPDDDPTFLELKALRENLIEKPRVKAQQLTEKKIKEDEIKREMMEKEAPEIEKEMVVEAVRESMAEPEEQKYVTTDESEVEQPKLTAKDLFVPMAPDLEYKVFDVEKENKNVVNNKYNMSAISSEDKELSTILS